MNNVFTKNVTCPETTHRIRYYSVFASMYIATNNIASENLLLALFYFSFFSVFALIIHVCIHKILIYGITLFNIAQNKHMIS